LSQEEWINGEQEHCTDGTNASTQCPAKQERAHEARQGDERNTQACGPECLAEELKDWKDRE
jgi:hypothetical protein